MYFFFFLNTFGTSDVRRNALEIKNHDVRHEIKWILFKTCFSSTTPTPPHCVRAFVYMSVIPVSTKEDTTYVAWLVGFNHTPSLSIC